MYIRESKTALDATRRGRDRLTLVRYDWDEIKGEVMLPIVREKFKQNPDLAEKLLATGNAYLIEGNYWHDNYFGICTCKECHHKGEGKNVLGRILMQVRDELAPPIAMSIGGRYDI